MENDFAQLWRLVSELSEQLAQNRAITASLQAQAGSVNSAASHQGTGFALRRFNMHMSQETYETELERMSASFVQQNSELQNDNKQLAGLLKEYEQTLETVMTKFRTHAHDAIQHELSLTRHYESLLISRETSIMATDLAAATAYSQALGRMSDLLRKALRTANGEPADPESPIEDDSALTLLPSQGGYTEGLDLAQSQSTIALEREIEFARLERENHELRRLAGLPSLTPLHSNSPTLPLRWDPVEAEGLHGGQRIPPSQLNLNPNMNLSMGVNYNVGMHPPGGMGMHSGMGGEGGEDSMQMFMRRSQQLHQEQFGGRGGIIPGQTQISLDPESSNQHPPSSHSQTVPLQNVFPPDPPLVTRKYGNRSRPSGPFMNTPQHPPQPNFIPSSVDPNGTFRGWGGGGLESRGPGERNMNLQEQQRGGREGEQIPSGWDPNGVTSMYLNTLQWKSPLPRET